MLKNFVLLVILAWVGFSYAKPVEKETISDAHDYKVDKASAEHDAQRSVAGSKIKKNNPEAAKTEKHAMEESDSEVRYWEYSE